MDLVMPEVSLFWFRRDLRLQDNAGLFEALRKHKNVLLIFIFDLDILKNLENKSDLRVQFIYQEIGRLKEELIELGSDLLVRHGSPLNVLKQLSENFHIQNLYCNHDYEPSTRKRDEHIQIWCQKKGISFFSFKDQTLFEKDEILTTAGNPYTVFTPYKNKVLQNMTDFYLKSYPTERYLSKSLLKIKNPERLLTIDSIGFKHTSFIFPDRKASKNIVRRYGETRDFPAIKNGTTHLGLHLRFGTVSVRTFARLAKENSNVWLSELIWRDFFMQILWHFPEVENSSFRTEYDKIKWRNSKRDFQRWSQGQTGYPLVDAGMRELNATGYMHNRVRMVVASFLCKHLLIHWYKGERYFAKKLLDFDLAANNGNWQWAAGSGCDAAPYFRIFNPETQWKKFDSKQEYILKWVPELNSSKYVSPIIDHAEARSRCLYEYAKALKK